MIGPPEMRRDAAIPVGMVFTWGGRPLQVVRVLGTDPAAPVIVEELVAVGPARAGQYALWSADGVSRAAGLWER